jgi:hypothetical protein
VAGGYARHARSGREPGALAGMRLGVIRESMVYPAGSKSEQPIVDAACAEIKSVLGRHLGATLVESGDPLWTPDPDCERMTVDFRRALARMVPVLMPELLFRLGADGLPLFREFAESIVRTEFQPGKFFGSGSMQPIDYFVNLAEGLVQAPSNLDLPTVQQQEMAMAFRFHLTQYLGRRSADWKARGFTESVVDFPTLNARTKFWGDDQRAWFANWEAVADMRNPLGQRQGINERIMLRELLRRVDMMVMYENRLDALVRLHSPYPPAKIGSAGQPGVWQNLRPESLNGPNAGLTEVLVPAGYVDTVYDPEFRLSADCQRYETVRSERAQKVAAPGLPFSLVFRCEPGREDVLLKVASSYEAA